MANYVLSIQAVLDLQAIADYGYATFGVAKAREYGEALEHRFEQLAESPAMGVQADEIANGLRRFKQGSHWIFYVEQADGIFVARVLHERMDFVRHL